MKEINNNVITMPIVVKGLKFIAENQNLTYDELANGLVELGCNFTQEDIDKQFPEAVLLFDGIKKCDIACGACIIANVRDNENAILYVNDRFLSVDDEFSIYNFIRTATGDINYTKENLNNITKSSRTR